VPDLRLILERASRESARSGINALDSLHIAAAHLLHANEFITTEKPGRSIYRTSLKTSAQRTTSLAGALF
jgi:hypothetical protein